jgi:PKD repeat protein
MKNNYYQTTNCMYYGIFFIVANVLFTFTAFAQLSGNYTLDPNQAASGTNYTTFNSFITDLSSNGVSGSVTLDVTSNETFNEQVTIPQIAGMSSSNRVTVNGNGSLLTFNGTTSARHTLWLNGADYFTFDNLRISGTNTTFVYTVRLSNQADYNVFKNCEISAPNYNYTSQTISRSANVNTGSASAIIAFTYQSNNLANNTATTNGRGNLFQNNKLLGPDDNSNLRGPTYGIFEQGTSSTAAGENEFIGNEIKNFSGIGIYAFRSAGGKYNFNKISRQQNQIFQNTTTTTYSYGIWLCQPYLSVHTSKETEVIGNEITKIGRANGSNTRYFYGIAVQMTNATTGSYNSNGRKVRVERNIIADNYTGLTSTNSFYFYGISSYYASQVDIINNIISNNKPVTYSNSLNYYYYRPIYSYYSRGSNILHNTIHEEHTTPGNSTNYRWYNYGMYVYICCGSYQNHEHIRANNNVIYFDISPSGAHYDNYPYYLYYITEAKNNVVENKGGYYDRAGYMCRVGNTSSCAGYATTGNIDMHNNTESGASDNIEADPMFVDAANYNFAFTNPDLNASALNMNIPVDFNGDSRNPSFPDRGAVEVTFDYALSGTFLGGATVCGSYEENIKATVQNLMPFPLGTAKIGYILNDKAPHFQEDGPLPANGNLEITFDDPVQFFGEPSPSYLKVFIAHADDNNANDTLYYTINVLRSPYGSDLIPNLNTQARLSDFPMINPDVSIPGEVVEHEITAPAIYTNSGYCSDWTATTNAFIVGSNSPAVGLSWTPPSGNDNGVWSYNPQYSDENETIEIQLIIEDLNNGCDTTIRRRVIVAPTGTAQFKLPPQICLGEEIEFENESDVSSGFLYYEWDFGNGETSDATNGRTTYNAPGDYDVTLYNITEPNGFITSNTVTITVTEAPVPNFDFVNKCYGTPVEFSNSSTVGAGTVGNTTWDFGDGNTDAGENTSHLYAQEGMYPVTMVTEANGCVKEITKNIVQFAQPTADFNLVSGDCQFTEFKFSNNSSVEFGFIGYMWKFDDNGSISTQDEPSHTFQTFGSKSITLIATTALGCVDSITQTINVSPGPSADFTLSNECQHKDIELIATDIVPSGLTALYDWDMDDAGQAMGDNALASYPWPGKRTISLEVHYDNGCSNSTSKEVDIQPTPVADFSLVDACAEEEVNFANLTSTSAGELAFVWNFGDGNSSTVFSPIHVYSSATDQSYDVELVASVINGCSDEITKTINIFANPTTCDFTIQHQGEDGFRNFIFTPTDGTTEGPQNGVTYSWFFEDGSSFEGDLGMNNFQQDGTYEVTMVARNDNDCECRMTKTVSVDMVGLNDVELAENFLIYPNPNNGQFNISLNGFEGITQIEILSLTGQNIYTQSTESELTEINLTNLAEGMYLVKLTNNGKTAVTKINVNSHLKVS